eukprot:scaffold20448_cov90-Cylindrotheca_fusiformis.AAC.2
MADENSAMGRASFAYCFVVEFALTGSEDLRPDEMTVCSEIARSFAATYNLTQDFEIVVRTEATKDAPAADKYHSISTLCKKYLRNWRGRIRRSLANSKRGIFRPTISVPYGSQGKNVGGGRGGSKSRFYYTRDSIYGHSDPAIMIDYAHDPTWKGEWRMLCHRIGRDWSIHGFALPPTTYITPCSPAGCHAAGLPLIAPRSTATITPTPAGDGGLRAAGVPLIAPRSTATITPPPAGDGGLRAAGVPLIAPRSSATGLMPPPMNTRVLQQWNTGTAAGVTTTCCVAATRTRGDFDFRDPLASTTPPAATRTVFDLPPCHPTTEEMAAVAGMQTSLVQATGVGTSQRHQASIVNSPMRMGTNSRYQVRVSGPAARDGVVPVRTKEPHLDSVQHFLSSSSTAKTVSDGTKRPNCKNEKKKGGSKTMVTSGKGERGVEATDHCFFCPSTMLSCSTGENGIHFYSNGKLLGLLAKAKKQILLQSDIDESLLGFVCVPCYDLREGSKLGRGERRRKRKKL